VVADDVRVLQPREEADLVDREECVCDASPHGAPYTQVCTTVGLCTTVVLQPREDADLREREGDEPNHRDG